MIDVYEARWISCTTDDIYLPLDLYKDTKNVFVIRCNELYNSIYYKEYTHTHKLCISSAPYTDC